MSLCVLGSLVDIGLHVAGADITSPAKVASVSLPIVSAGREATG